MIDPQMWNAQAETMGLPANTGLKKNFTLKVTQAYRLTREITVHVQAPSLEDAIEIQVNQDSPAWTDPRWLDHPELMHEQVKPL